MRGTHGNTPIPFFRPAAAFVSLGLLALSACGGGGGDDGSPGTTPPPAAKLAIRPMTTVSTDAHTGYFSDPYPIPMLAPPSGAVVPAFAGTTRQTLSCTGSLQPDCFTSSPNTIDGGTVATLATTEGSTILGYENLNSFQDSTGAWQMAVTASVTKPGAANPWHVILHAHPTSTGSGIPTAWSADKLLVGSLTDPAGANYDGKYFDDSGTLYLVYSRKIDGQKADGIVAQAMQSATVPASSLPVQLLGPETADGGYNSELFLGPGQTDTFKLIETGNIAKIQGKYVMAYSTGGYNMPDYKASVAWSDSFLPTTPGTYYKRAQKVDTAGVWGTPNHAEVVYLLQSQRAQWPNYAADQVLSPGVPSIVSDTSGHYFLFFAGYAPSDAPIVPATNNYDGSHRRPFYIGLNVQIPQNATVDQTSPQDLANWIQPIMSR